MIEIAENDFYSKAEYVKLQFDKLKEQVAKGEKQITDEQREMYAERFLVSR